MVPCRLPLVRRRLRILPRGLRMVRRHVPLVPCGLRLAPRRVPPTPHSSPLAPRRVRCLRRAGLREPRALLQASRRASFLLHYRPTQANRAQRREEPASESTEPVAPHPERHRAPSPSLPRRTARAVNQRPRQRRPSLPEPSPPRSVTSMEDRDQCIPEPAPQPSHLSPQALTPPGWQESAGFRETFLYHVTDPEDLQNPPPPGAPALRFEFGDGALRAARRRVRDARGATGRSRRPAPPPGLPRNGRPLPGRKRAVAGDVELAALAARQAHAVGGLAAALEQALS